MKDPSRLEFTSPIECVKFADSNSNVESNEPVFWTLKLTVQVNQNHSVENFDLLYEISIVGENLVFRKFIPEHLLRKIRICTGGINFSFRD